MEGLWDGDDDPGEVGVGWVQEDVPLVFDRDGGDLEGDGALRGDPVCSDGLEGGVVEGAPIGGEVFDGETFDGDFAGREGGGGGDEVGRGDGGVEVDEELNGGEREGGGGVDHADACGVPATLVEAGAFSGEG